MNTLLITRTAREGSLVSCKIEGVVKINCLKSWGEDLKIPSNILKRFEEKMEGMQFSAVKLTVSFNPKAGKPRFVIIQETSLLSDKEIDIQK